MLAEDLTQFTGTEHHYLEPLSRMKYTDGVKYFADTAGAYWFLDIIFSEFSQLQRSVGFMSISLDVQGSEAIISATDGNNFELKGRRVDYTDCPAGTYKFFFCDDVLLLQSEY